MTDEGADARAFVVLKSGAGVEPGDRSAQASTVRELGTGRRDGEVVVPGAAEDPVGRKILHDPCADR